MTGKLVIKYLQGDEKLIDEIENLWVALNQHHMEKSVHFKHHYQQMSFGKRKATLLKKAKNGKMHVDLAVDESTNQKVGYIVSSINEEKTGEIESVFVASDYRAQGISDKLMCNALCWMDENGTVEKIVEVSVGNEKAFSYYGKFGFRPRKTVLEQVKER